METGVEAFAKGYAAMGAVREDMASQDILKSLYAGKDAAEVSKDPAQEAATLNQASALAAQRGYASLAHSFQKQAGDLSKNVQAEQLNDIKVKQSRLNYADQFLSAATNEDELKNAFAPIKDEAAQMQIQSIIRNPNIPFDQKKSLLGNMTKTVSQRLAAERLATDAEYKEGLLEERAAERLRKEKKDAKSIAGAPDKTENKELAALDLAEAKDLAKAETNPYVSDKEGAKAKIKAEYEKKRQAARERRGGGKETTKKSEFVEGQVYEDANGNRAKYSKGRWIPVQ
jgi:hypothetical protein